MICSYAWRKFLARNCGGILVDAKVAVKTRRVGNRFLLLLHVKIDIIVVYEAMRNAGSKSWLPVLRYTFTLCSSCLAWLVETFHWLALLFSLPWWYKFKLQLCPSIVSALCCWCIFRAGLHLGDSKVISWKPTCNMLTNYQWGNYSFNFVVFCCSSITVLSFRKQRELEECWVTYRIQGN